jgi:hypothetical protein
MPPGSAVKPEGAVTLATPPVNPQTVRIASLAALVETEVETLDPELIADSKVLSMGKFKDAAPTSNAFS